GNWVHTERTLHAVCRCTDCPVVYASLPHEQTERGMKRTIGPPYRLILFGYIGKNRRLKSVLHALGAMPRRNLFRLAIYGEVWNVHEVRELIAASGLQNL